ncbi:hypothetical protein AGMMS49944_05730 [Spirochaetia bacterium]|nr:hypothetical protein AGMMS49944_05730 [Spirochaetia bacterium]
MAEELRSVYRGSGAGFDQLGNHGYPPLQGKEGLFLAIFRQDHHQFVKNGGGPLYYITEITLNNHTIRRLRLIPKEVC